MLVIVIHFSPLHPFNGMTQADAILEACQRKHDLIASGPTRGLVIVGLVNSEEQTVPRG